MSPHADPVVVTGVGVLSSAGRGLGALGDALAADRLCAEPARTELPVPLVAAVPGQVAALAAFPDDRKCWLAWAAALDAVADAGGVPDDTAVFMGTGLSSVTPAELAQDIYPHRLAPPRDGRHFDRAAMAKDLAPDRAAPRRHTPERLVVELTALLGARGPTGTSFSACAAGSHAIAEGVRALRRGHAQVAVVGGHDSMLHPLGLLSFVVLGALSEDRCRPFDSHRSGFMIGEAAAVLVLERRSRAVARGAHIHAQVLGAGSSADAWNVTAPHPQGAGAELSMRRALADAGLDAAAVDHVNAHGTGTPVGDSAEAQAVHRVFGARVPVASIKGAVGHTIAAAGALEAAAVVACLQRGLLPGTVGLDTPDPACDVEVVQRARPSPLGVIVSNSFGFGGQNGSLVFAHADWQRSP